MCLLFVLLLGAVLIGRFIGLFRSFASGLPLWLLALIALVLRCLFLWLFAFVGLLLSTFALGLVGLLVAWLVLFLLTALLALVLLLVASLASVLLLLPLLLLWLLLLCLLLLTFLPVVLCVWFTTGRLFAVLLSGFLIAFGWFFLFRFGKQTLEPACLSNYRSRDPTQAWTAFQMDVA